MSRPRALDLFCGAGGVSVGLDRAGFDVTGVDIRPQPRHRGGTFIQADALAFPLFPPDGFDGYDFIWASPPCQAYTALRGRWPDRSYPNLIPETRARLVASGAPWVMENVVGAPLRRDLLLCGTMFDLRVYRHRVFEASLPLAQPEHPKHLIRAGGHKSQRQRKAHFLAGGFVTVTGNVGVYAGAAMGIDWMSGDELSQAIPPAYAEWIGRQALAALRKTA